MSHRLPAPLGDVIDRSSVISFTWNGKKLQGFEGDTIASALLANGEHILGRSMKYHRPRGVLTADFWDPNTTVQVDDEPNVAGLLCDIIEADGHRCAVALSGREALELLDQSAFDVILSDLRMPEMDGQGLHRAISETRAL